MRPRKAPAAAGEQPKTAPRKHRALTQAQLVARLLRIIEKPTVRTTRSSVRLQIGPRGQIMPEVLVHDEDDPELVGKLSLIAQRELDLLLVKYADRAPGGNGPAGE